MKFIHFVTRQVVFRSILSITVLLIAGAMSAVLAQSHSGEDRDRGRAMLQVIKDDLKKNYYDPTYHGMDLETRFKAADDKIKTATSLGRVFGIIAQVLVDLDDSHTFFLPPGRTTKTDYGWQMQMIGDKCYVVAVKPGSDAEAKGLREGDEIVTIDGFAPVRENLWKIQYTYYALRPVPSVRLAVIKPNGKAQELEVMAKVRQGRRVIDLTLNDSGAGIFDLIRQEENQNRLHRHRYSQIGEDLFVWKMPGFDMLKDKVDDFAGKFSKRKGLV